MKAIAYLTICIVLLSTAVLVLAGCHQKEYEVDYNSFQHLFSNAEFSYPKDKKAILYTTLPDICQGCAVYLDQEELKLFHDNRKGDYVCFVMPAHDIQLTVRNSLSDQFQAVLLANLYDAVQANESTESTEIVILSSPVKDTVLIEISIRQDDVDQTFSYQVPSAVYEQCIELCEKWETENWSERSDTDSIEGRKIVFKYLYKGKMIRVSTEEMIDEGMAFFQQMHTYLFERINEFNKLK